MDNAVVLVGIEQCLGIISANPTNMDEHAIVQLHAILTRLRSDITNCNTKHVAVGVPTISYSPQRYSDECCLIHHIYMFIGAHMHHKL